MKKKILSIFLLICMLVPCFAVFAFAEETEDDGALYYDQNLEVSTTSNGYQYRIGYNKFIDVEYYSQNAYNGTFNDMFVVGVDEVYYGNSLSLFIYCFNPKYYLDTNKDGRNGYVTISTPLANKEYEIPIDLLYFEDEQYFLFPVFEVSIPCAGIGNEFFETVDPDERVYDIKNLVICTDRSVGNDKEIPIHKRYIFKGFNANKTLEKQLYCDLDYTSPLSDLVEFLETDMATLVKTYPYSADKENEIVFMYEYVGKNGEHDLYLYVYNAKQQNYNSGYVMLYDGTYYRSVAMEHISTESTLSKFKISNASYYVSGKSQIREYYISEFALNYVIFKDKRLQLVTDKCTTEARFVYSDIPSDSFRPSSFYYDLSDTVIKAPSFAGNNAGKFLAGEEYLITFESKDIKNYAVYANAALFTITEQGEMWVKIKMLADSDSIYFSAFDFYSTFPDLNYPNLSISITRIVPEDATEEEKASITTGSMSVDVDVNFSPERIYPVLLMANDYVQPKAKYLTAEVNGVIKIDANYTYYRLDSSVNGNGCYQTLSTLYFSIPNKYLQNSVIPIVDSEVSAVELSYQSAKTIPIIYAATNHEDLKECLSDIENDQKNLTARPFIATVPYYTDGSHALVEKFSRFMFCKYDYSAIMMGGYDLRYIGDVRYDYPLLVIYGDGKLPVVTDEDNQSIAELLTSKQLNEYIVKLGDSAFSTDFVGEHYVLNFDDKKTLASYKDKTFWDVVEETNFFQAIFCKLAGYLGYYQDTIENIKCIQTMSALEMAAADEMSDEVFASTYYVALSDVPNIKSQIKNALKNNESFVLVRFDVFDYYCESAFGVSINEDALYWHKDTDFDNQVVVFQTKYYKNLDILRLETSNRYTTKLYDVEMDEISTPGGGVTGSKPLPGPGKNDGIDWKKIFDDLMKTLSIIFVVIVVLVVFIYFAPVIVPVIKAIFAFFKKMFVAIGSGIKRLTNRRKQ